MPTKKPKAPARPRVRRGNREDAERLRQDLMAAAVELFAEGGADAVSIRAIAARVGVSPMSTYRYFADKSELLGGLWQHVIHGLCDEIAGALHERDDARQRHRATLDAFLRYWEQRPSYYALLYGFSRVGQQRHGHAELAASPVYAEVLGLMRDVTAELAAAIGADMTHAGLAADVRLAMELGYLHGTQVVTRYPWSDTATLRAAYIERIQHAVEHCLLHGAATGEAVAPPPAVSAAPSSPTVRRRRAATADSA